MKKIFVAVALCLTLAQPVQAQAPVWGVFHSIHTQVSDGTESLSQRTNNLRMYYDFASTVDHDTMIDNSEWLQTIAEVDANQSLPDFVYFVGYEWCGSSSHHAEVSAFFVGDPPSVKVDGDDPNYDTLGEFATWLSANNGMGCVCHPAITDTTVIWADPGLQNEQIYPCVEMLNMQNYYWSDQWVCAEGSGCTTYNNPSPPARADWRGSVKNALDSGLQLGFVGAWDYHGGYPETPTAYTGLVGVTEWTKQAVAEAVRKRHTWAAEDRIRMNVTSGPYIMGDAFVTSGVVVPIDYDISAAPGKTIIQVNLFVDGIITQGYPFSGQEDVVGGIDIGLSANKHYVFLEVIQSDGKRAWSSPMYITPCGSVITRNVRVSASSDDSEERALTGEMYLTSSDLELINDSEYWGQQVVGIRFSGVDIPQGATIRNAYIQFKVDETSSEATSLRIAGEDVDDAVTFATSTGNVSSRTRTSAEVVWAPVAWTTVGEAGLDQRTPDLSSIVEEIVNRPGWSRGNSIAFIIMGTGKRVAVAYDEDPTGAPLLHVEYNDECPVDNPVPTTTGLNPSSGTAGGTAFTLTVNGSGFVSGSVVRWNGANRTTTVVSSTQLTAAISASDIAAAGTSQVTVFNPAPGGGTSNAQTFTINSGNVTDSTDFSEYTTGSPPGDWTERWNETYGSLNIVEDTAKYLHALPTSLVGYGFSWDALGSKSDVEVLAKFRSGTSATVGPSVLLRGSGTPGSRYGYHFYIDGSTLNAVRFSKYVNNVYTTNVASGAITGYSRNAWWWIRARVIGISIKCRVWKDGDSEPGTWNIDTTDSGVPGPGWTGGLTYSYGNATDYDYYAAAFDGATATINNPDNPVPTTTGLNPSSGTAGGLAFTLTVNGSGFVSGSVVRWNGANRTTTVVSSTQLTAAISASDIAVAGTSQVTVFNPTPGGGTSNAQTFTVNNPDNPVPTTTGLNPSSGTAGGPAFPLTVNGSGFVSGSVVRWNGADRTTTVVSSTQLTAAIPDSDIAVAGTAQVSVYNPSPGGGTSNAQVFTVNNPVPATTSLSPSSAGAGGVAFTLTVNGSGFVSNSVVRWNGADRTTTFVSSIQLTAAIPASDIAVAGTAQVTVYNPSAGGGTSNTQIFTINQSAPANMHIGDLDGTSKPVGSKWWNATVTITVHDENHNPVQKATVKGTWSGPTATTNSCTTNVKGLCSVTSNILGNSTSTVIFTVTNVTHSSLLYTPTSNHDPDGDSNGTVIVVLKSW